MKDKAKIKWVNDVFINNGKVSGILTKVADDVKKSMVSLGIGVNLNVSPHLGPNDKNKAASVKNEMGLDNDLDVELFVNRLSEALIRNIKILES
jgi:BirA family biotin operon repressor/biotin-[acetyl-CoA-carboxylase] ligase